jgi:hypothetical protein
MGLGVNLYGDCSVIAWSLAAGLGATFQWGTTDRRHGDGMRNGVGCGIAYLGGLVVRSGADNN